MFGTIENLRISGSVACNGALGAIDHQEIRQSAAQTGVLDMTRMVFAPLPILALEAGLCVFHQSQSVFFFWSFLIDPFLGDIRDDLLPQLSSSVRPCQTHG